MTTRPEHDEPPSDYRLLLPDGWFRILLDPEQRDRSVDALVERRFQGIDNAPHLKDEMRADLRRRAAEAYHGGGIELYLSFQEAGPLTIPASLLVSLAPLRGPEPLSPHDLAAAFAKGAEPDEDDTKVSVEELAAGTAVRVRSATRPTERERQEGQRASVSVEYHVPVPGSAQYLLLTFSTPLEPVADAMAGLFDAIASSLTWTE
ncbi:hypothetical protein ROS62_05155 [Streptomyces sp. DSM 41972]|uniref:EspG family protein n=1 Tax=Streptomyces althioticus subsp. attaecolombicae TaxID=3075534 RepID=A0ABU3HUG0_9ACTN|nr:hypothetical protein [Streptomyces sp. DSM 41972]SCE06116.1 hypothetical protein GA0115238_144820 [Streptomyces sp. di50b]SCE36951.1 hypothetical protein GA0115245_132421 [Streptomyces sp. di188]